MISKKDIKRFYAIKTPFYFYDLNVLRNNLDKVKNESEKYGFIVHYAIKANANPDLLKLISTYGFGADCVSGNEIKRSIETGFKAEKIAFAGVGKSDSEIITGLENSIFTFNVESLPELSVIEELATKTNKKANIALRINPNVDAFTHRHITTGIEDTKFGINAWELEDVLSFISNKSSLRLTGLHFHIGSQVRELAPFKALCIKINDLQNWFNSRNIYPGHINVGGGLGIDYEQPEQVADFKNYFSLFNELLELRPGQTVHFELGRSIVAQAGSLISKVLYIKKGIQNDYVIVDAGMTDLIRPALYQAFHKIENLTSKEKTNKKYNVVGPICESTDIFGKFVELPLTKRGDLIAIRSAGAYGEVMTSNYNLRDKAGILFSE